VKILHLIDHLSLGGAQSLLKDLFESQQDNNAIFLFSMRTKKHKNEIDHSNIFQIQSRNLFFLKPLILLIKFISKHEIEILHCHLLRSKIFGILLKSIFFPDLKLIFHEHGRIFQSNVLYPIFLNLSKNNVDLFLAVSHATENKLLAKTNIKPNKIKVLYNGINTQIFNRNNINWDIKKEKEKLGIGMNDFVVGYAGRIIKSKGWLEFVSSANILINQNYPFKFLIAGEGKDSQKLLRYINNNNLQNQVIYLGYQSEMVRFYSWLDCFVLPSYHEALGLTVLEAQALGIPVIASDVQALNEILHDKKDALLYDPRNIKDLCSKVKQIYTNDALRIKLVINGVDNSRSFKLQNYCRELNEVYLSFVETIDE